MGVSLLRFPNPSSIRSAPEQHSEGLYQSNKSLRLGLRSTFVMDEIRNVSARYLDCLSDPITPRAISMPNEAAKTFCLRAIHTLDPPFGKQTMEKPCVDTWFNCYAKSILHYLLSSSENCHFLINLSALLCSLMI